MLVASPAPSEGVRADVALSPDPPVGSFPMFDWSRLEDLAETGYRFATRSIERWRQSSVACRRGSRGLPRSA